MEKNSFRLIKSEMTLWPRGKTIWKPLKYNGIIEIFTDSLMITKDSSKTTK